MKPLFEADSEDFLLTLFNMNYTEKSKNVGQGKYVAQIIQMIRKNNKITQEEMTNVEYIGRGQNGHWEIKE